MSRVFGPAEPEVGCDECFDELDRYVDLVATGRDAEDDESLHALVIGESGS